MVVIVYKKNSFVILYCMIWCLLLLQTSQLDNLCDAEEFYSELNRTCQPCDDLCGQPGSVMPINCLTICTECPQQQYLDNVTGACKPCDELCHWENETGTDKRCEELCPDGESDVSPTRIAWMIGMFLLIVIQGRLLYVTYTKKRNDVTHVRRRVLPRLTPVTDGDWRQNGIQYVDPNEAVVTLV